MKEKSFFQTRVGQQAVAGLVTILSFPFLYSAHSKESMGLAYIGIVLFIIGMAAAPIISYLDGWNQE